MLSNANGIKYPGFNKAIVRNSIVPALRAGIIHNDTLPLVPVAAYKS